MCHSQFIQSKQSQVTHNCNRQWYSHYTITCNSFYWFRLTDFLKVQFPNSAMWQPCSSSTTYLYKGFVLSEVFSFHPLHKIHQEQPASNWHNEHTLRKLPQWKSDRCHHRSTTQTKISSNLQYRQNYQIRWLHWNCDIR